MTTAPDQILTTLQERIRRHRARYGAMPDRLPVTLNEMAWLSDALGMMPAMPSYFGGVPLRLVQEVHVRADGAMVVRP